MNNTALSNLIILSVSLTIVICYISYVKRFGKLPNISVAAKYLTKEGKQYLTFIFIASVSLPLMWVGQTILLTISGAIILCIGILTGHNPNIKNKNLEDWLHLKFAKIGIAGGIIQMVIFQSWIGGALTFTFIIYSIVLLVKKDDQSTWKIEVAALLVIYPVLFLEKVVLL